MIGGAGNDLIKATDDGSFFDFIQVDYASSASGINAAANGSGGLTVQDGLGGTDTVIGVHVLRDSGHDDTISVDTTYQTSFGNFLEVRLSGGDDMVTFGSGFAGRIGYQRAKGAVHADLATGTATDLNPADNFIGNDTFIGTVAVLRGSKFGDELLGSSGNDHLRGEGGNDTIDGRGGFDRVEFNGSSSGVNVNLAKGKVFNDGLGGHDTVMHIEGVAGSDFNDVIGGNGGGNLLNGNLGDDTIHGKGGADTINGDFGIDSEAASGGWTSNDSLYGDAGNDRIVGGAGADHLFGGGGNDTWTAAVPSARSMTPSTTATLLSAGHPAGRCRQRHAGATSGDVLMIGGAGNDLIMATDDGSLFRLHPCELPQLEGRHRRCPDGAGGLTVLDGLGGTDTVQGVHVLLRQQPRRHHLRRLPPTRPASAISSRCACRQGDDKVTFTGFAGASAIRAGRRRSARRPRYRHRHRPQSRATTSSATTPSSAPSAVLRGSSSPMSCSALMATTGFAARAATTPSTDAAASTASSSAAPIPASMSISPRARCSTTASAATTYGDAHRGGRRLGLRRHHRPAMAAATCSRQSRR